MFFKASIFCLITEIPLNEENTVGLLLLLNKAHPFSYKLSQTRPRDAQTCLPSSFIAEVLAVPDVQES